ncbi:hypothetical protein [Micromonospora sp. NBC_01796]|uniref:hypothetical protein n=1 Tax=Micromonospora sp. NBC_01796 TaxID=2975987 RepID=UPI002DDC2098|nr:hypothetical protein [Micromonospora sp. NBC_01796]WSA86717.1 hypothetical protein OIE47_03565 [Micromonospora sp. NBC_01796]
MMDEELPPAFEERYERIIDGEERLDTVAKLKDFWLFAVEQGWKHRELREAIARATFHAVERDSYGSLLVYLTDPQLKDVHIEWDTMVVIGKSPYPEKETDDQYSDRLWAILEFEVGKVEVPAK